MRPRTRIDENGWLIPLHTNSKAYAVYTLMRAGALRQVVWRILHPDKAHKHKYTPRSKPRLLRQIRPKTVAIWQMLGEGKNAPEIARALNIPRHQVHNAAQRGRRRGDQRCKDRRTHAPIVEDILNLWAAGATCPEIRAKLGCSHGRIAKALQNARQRKIPDPRAARRITNSRKNPKVPEYLIAERERRKQIEHRSLTAAQFGDPLPGYSALDRRR